MKKCWISFMVACLASVQLFAAQKGDEMNVMSYNIRMDTSGDGENAWPYRKDLAGSMIRFHEVDIFGAQEVLHHQLTDLLERLPGYDYVGVGREDGKTKGEYAPIIYRKARFTVEKHGDFWLAEDIHAVGKKGWDAACERVATWAIFKDTQSGKRFFFLNTHLDHIGQVARHEGAELVLAQSAQLSEGLPIIVTGDFNATPEDEPIQVLTKADDARHLTHTRQLATVKYGPEWTFHNYGRIPFNERQWIDYIFVKGNFKVTRHGVITDTQNQLFPSDHCPILCTMTIE